MKNKTYKVFKRSCQNWKEFVTARKYIIRRGITLNEAQVFCYNFNNNRTEKEIARNTKYEFTKDAR